MLLKNTWLFAKQHSALFVLLILTQLAAIMGILLSYGIVLNNQFNLKAAERDFHSMRILFEEKQKQDEIVETILKAFPDVLNGYESVFDRGNVELYAPWELENTGLDEVRPGWIRVACVFGYDGRAYTTTDDASKYNANSIVGEWFSDDAYNTGLKQCIVKDQIYHCEQEKLKLGTGEYEIIAHEQEKGAFITSPVFIPLEAISEGMEVEFISLLFVRPLTHTEYSELYSRIVNIFGPLPEYEDNCSLDIDEKATMHTMIINSILIALLASFTVCLLYRYLLEKRKVMTAVYEICGCTGWRAAGLYIGEMLLLFACTAIGGMLVFWYVIKPYMEKSFPWFSAIYIG